MDHFINCRYIENGWEKNVTQSVTYNSVETVPNTKQRCQANARERDRTQKLVQIIFKILQKYEKCETV